MYLFGAIVVVVVIVAVIVVIGARRSARRSDGLRPTDGLRPGEDVPDAARDAGHPDQPADWDPRRRYGAEDGRARGDRPDGRRRRPDRGAGPST